MDANPTPAAVTIDDTENPPSVDYATFFKTLQDLLEDGTKPAMEEQSAALENMFTQRMKDILEQSMQDLSNIQAETILRLIDRLTQDNTRLQSQVVDLTRNVRNMVAAIATCIWTPSTITISLPLISNPRVTAVMAEPQSPRQHKEATMEQNLRTLQQANRSAPWIHPTPTLSHLSAKAKPLPARPVQSKGAVVAAGTTGSQTETWYTVNRWMQTTTVVC